MGISAFMLRSFCFPAQSQTHAKKTAQNAKKPPYDAQLVKI
jgi:hypothetical protein